ncbi:MAG TPA: hypothetical protein VMR76_03035 [Candidatus Saccharimonadia bacterium]|nr:hypothetical protein [Candidatus Saccharimonadia bacterium]
MILKKKCLYLLGFIVVIFLVSGFKVGKPSFLSTPSVNAASCSDSPANTPAKILNNGDMNDPGLAQYNDEPWISTGYDEIVKEWLSPICDPLNQGPLTETAGTTFTIRFHALVFYRGYGCGVKYSNGQCSLVDLGLVNLSSTNAKYYNQVPSGGPQDRTLTGYGESTVCNVYPCSSYGPSGSAFSGNLIVAIGVDKTASFDDNTHFRAVPTGNSNLLALCFDQTYDTLHSTEGKARAIGRDWNATHEVLNQCAAGDNGNSRYWFVSQDYKVTVVPLASIPAGGVTTNVYVNNWPLSKFLYPLRDLGCENDSSTPCLDSQNAQCVGKNSYASSTIKPDGVLILPSDIAMNGGDPNCATHTVQIQVNVAGPSHPPPPPTGPEPFFKVNGGDTLVGSGFGGSCSTESAGIVSSNVGAPTWLGSGDNISTLAPSIINGFSTDNSGDKLTFANTSNAPYGGGFGSSSSSYCMEDYFGTATTVASAAGLPSLPIITTNNLDIGVPLPSGCVLYNQTNYCYLKPPIGNTVIISDTGGTPVTPKLVVYVDGNAFVSSNISLSDQTQPLGSASDVPLLYLISSKNIYISSGVDSIGGIYVAEDIANPDSSGIIFTCANNSSQLSFTSSTSFISACNTQLTINGALVANQIKAGRLFGDIGSHAPNLPAETINYGPNIWLSQANSTQAGNPTILSETELSPVL